MTAISEVAWNALANNCELDPIEKISMSQRYQLSRKWARDAFEKICSRAEQLNLAEASQLGLETCLLIFRSREEILRKRLGGLGPEHESSLVTEVVANIIISGEPSRGIIFILIDFTCPETPNPYAHVEQLYLRLVATH